MQQKQPTWNTKSRARITNSDELSPVPHRAHRRDENNLQNEEKQYREMKKKKQKPATRQRNERRKKHTGKVLNAQDIIHTISD